MVPMVKYYEIYYVSISVLLCTCTDIDECALGFDLCSDLCVNNPGSYECRCQSGFILQDAFTCQDIDECAILSDQCNTLSGASCVNTVGSYMCTCLADGYIIDSSGLNCTGEYDQIFQYTLIQ